MAMALLVIVVVMLVAVALLIMVVMLVAVALLIIVVVMLVAVALLIIMVVMLVAMTLLAVVMMVMMLVMLVLKLGNCAVQSITVLDRVKQGFTAELVPRSGNDNTVLVMLTKEGDCLLYLEVLGIVGMRKNNGR